jgi:hypothetical protein
VREGGGVDADGGVGEAEERHPVHVLRRPAAAAAAAAAGPVEVEGDLASVCMCVGGGGGGGAWSSGAVPAGGAPPTVRSARSRRKLGENSAQTRREPGVNRVWGGASAEAVFTH